MTKCRRIGRSQFQTLILLSLLLASMPCSAEERSKQQAFRELEGHGTVYWKSNEKLHVVIGDANRWPFDVDAHVLENLGRIGPIEKLYIEYHKGFQPKEYKFLESIQSIKHLAIAKHRGEAGEMAAYIAKCKELESLRLHAPYLSASDLVVLGRSESLTEVTLSCRQLTPEHITAIAENFQSVKTLRLCSFIKPISSPDDIRKLARLPKLTHLMIDFADLSLKERNQLIEELSETRLQFIDG